jgi:hypothetical protein
MTVSPRLGAALRNIDTRTVLCEIRPRTDKQSQRTPPGFQQSFTRLQTVNGLGVTIFEP